MRPAKLTLEATLNLEYTGIHKYVQFVTGLAFLLDSRIVAVNSINKKCFIFDKGLKRQVSAYKFKHKPEAVACFRENTLAVTLRYVE